MKMVRRGQRVVAAGRSVPLGLPLGLLLGSCASSTAPTTRWIELFDGHSLGAFTSTEFGGEGLVVVRDSAIQLGFGSPLTGVTWNGAPPFGDYELEVRAARKGGGDFFCGVTFPVGNDHLTLVLGGWGGTVCGFSSLDGLDAAHNATRTLHRFEKDREYIAHVAVTATSITATLDGEPLCRVDRHGTELSLRPEVLLSRPLGIASFATEAAIRSVRWRPLVH